MPLQTMKGEREFNKWGIHFVPIKTSAHPTRAQYNIVGIDYVTKWGSKGYLEE